MKGIHIVCMMLITAGSFPLAVNAHAVPNPRVIAWRASDVNYVSSLYPGVLGRNPSAPADQQTIQSFTQLLAYKKISRVDVLFTPQDNFIDLRIISEDVGEVRITALEIRPLHSTRCTECVRNTIKGGN